MDVSEFIGFIIGIIAMIIMFFKRHWDERRKRADPKKYEEIERERQKVYRDFLRTIQGEEPEEEQEREVVEQEIPPPLPSPLVMQRESPHTLMAACEPLTVRMKEVDPYQIYKKDTVPRVQKMVKTPSFLSRMIVYREIIGPPKGAQWE